jgi:hypothetical protein
MFFSVTACVFANDLPFLSVTYVPNWNAVAGSCSKMWVRLSSCLEKTSMKNGWEVIVV